MGTEIYYFSGTGNSLMIARTLAEALGATLTPVAQALARDEIATDADVVGIVFPVYYGGLPAVIRRFANRLSGIEGKYVFAVSNFGGASGSSLGTLRRIIKSRGGELAAGYGIHMPQNAFFKSSENHHKIYAQCARRLKQVARNTVAKKRGMFPASPVNEVLFRLMFTIFQPLYRKNFKKRSGAPPGTDTDGMTALLDKAFTAGGKCTGCGVCAAVCPASNIRIEGGRPAWQHRCENCLACLNWCPGRAIEGSIGQAGYYYRHPGVKVAEMVRQSAGRAPAAAGCAEGEG